MRHYIKISIIVCHILFLSANAMAQPHYSHVLKKAEENSPILMAAAKRAEAEKSAAHRGALLPNPEVNATYYWGDPSEIGTRWDLNITQSIDMPSVLVRQAHLRDLQEHAAELNYETVRYNLFLEIQQLCADRIYYNAIATIYSQRCVSAIRLAQLYQNRFASGDCSILEYNRAQMYLADIQNQAAIINLKNDHTINELRFILGDSEFNFLQSDFDSSSAILYFEEWYDRQQMRNPNLRKLANQVEISQQQQQLSRAQWLPKMQVGYGSENRIGETFRGVIVGLELPLWSQQRAIRTARLEAESAQLELTTQRNMDLEHIQCMTHRYNAMVNNVKILKEALQRFDSQEYLDRALDAGEIALEQYLQQTDYYLDMALQYWANAYELEQLHLKIHSVEL